MSDVPLVLIGFGKVGRALARLLDEREGFRKSGVRLRLQAVFDRGGVAFGEDLTAIELLRAKDDGGTVAASRRGRSDLSLEEVLNRLRGAILIDASPTEPESGEPGLSMARRGLERGHSVVFASKGPLVAGFSTLHALANGRSCRLGLSAAVGTPLPSLETGLLSLHGCHLQGFRALLNETSNRILRDMESGDSYEKAVENAREAGVLETDPRLDLEGWDTAFKVLILARAFWSPALPLPTAQVKGIGALDPSDLTKAVAEQKRWRLLGKAALEPSGDVDIRVEPERLASDDPLYPLGPGEKGAVFESDLMGRFVIRSGKAGPFATAAAIVKDVLNIVAHPRGFAL